MNKIADFQNYSKNGTPTTILPRKIKSDICAFLANQAGEILVYNSTQPQNPQIILHDPSAMAITALEYAPSLLSILAGNNRGSISLIDIESNKVVASFAKHSNKVRCIKIYNNQTNCFVSGSLDTSVRLWDIRQKQEISSFRGHSKQINDVCLSPGDAMIVTCSDDGSAKLWNLTSNKMINEFQTKKRGSVMTAAFHPREFQLGVGGGERQVHSYNFDNFNFQGNSKEMPDTITHIAFEESGRNLYVAGSGFLKILSPFDMSVLENIETGWKRSPKLLFSDTEVYGLAIYSNSVRLSKLGMNIEKTESEKNKKPNFGVSNTEQINQTQIPFDEEQEFKDLQLLKHGHTQIMNTLRAKIESLSPIISAIYEQENFKAAWIAIDKLNDDKAITDLLNVFLNNGTLKKINTEFAILLIRKAATIFDNKYKFCLKTSLKFSLEIIKQFGNDIVATKQFSTLTKPDIEREDRINKYDLLLNEIDNMMKRRFFVKLLTQFQSEEIGILAQALVNDFNFIISQIKK